MMKIKISYYIPKDNLGYKSFIDKELSYALNIQDKTDKNSIITGLKKIKRELTDGKAYFWDGEKELFVVDYNGNSGKYHCGRDYDVSLLGFGKNSKYLLVVMDANHCTIGILNGKRIEKIWDKKSYVPRKQDAGGQSQKRFERAREEALKQWFKKVSEKVSSYVKT